ncbi:hypothetical protein COCNU_01G020750 [Cocos nucifera]|uniref:Sugar phosphate transporter domain-containing protein n=1 Tax=Cocos nucifera TaxID=13894 RepID=A0A8K0HXA5_COCNU|nr:hypothetical protein COCNU_01G020750 [Cocos nucifera]
MDNKRKEAVTITVSSPLPMVPSAIAAFLVVTKPGMELRSFSGAKSFCEDDIDLEDSKVAKDREKISRFYRPVKIHNQALLSGLAYCISSCSMILVNKYVLSGYDFNAGISLMLYQNIVSVIIVTALRLFGVISTEPLTWKLIKVWLPVNVIFVGMLITSIFSLKYINVAMVTILKNVTNVITALGETYLFQKHHGNKVWAALFLMVFPNCNTSPVVTYFKMERGKSEIEYPYL